MMLASGNMFTNLNVMGVAKKSEEVEIVEVRKIWDKAPHNAFGDLVRYKDRWFCAFREAQGHLVRDGSLRVISSPDGEKWESAAHITWGTDDLRDAKTVIAPDGRLMLSGIAVDCRQQPFRYQTLAWYSDDGKNWGDAIKIGDPDVWLWRTTWHKGTAYCIGYSTTKQRFIRLYASRDGKKFDTVVDNMFDKGFPNETSMLFLEDDTSLCLVRREYPPEESAMLGIAKPPYTDWEWKDLGVQVGGPNMIRLPDRRIVAVVRLYDEPLRTSLLWLDTEAGTLTEFLKLPSGGDTSYAGLALHDDLLWIAYYSSHEGKANMYLAKLRFPA